MKNFSYERVYIAAASSDIERVIHVRSLLQNSGLVVTSRWIDEVKSTGANPAEFIERRKRSLNDLVDVSSSDVVLFLLPGDQQQTEGAWFEIGYAYALGTALITSGFRTKKSVFLSLSTEFESDADAVSHLLQRE